MNELPETLDKTYERILTNIPVNKRKIAHKVLQFLAFDEDDNLSGNADKLAEAVIVDVEQLSFKPEYRFLDRNSLFEICTCLITLTTDGRVILAHYSVKEYLISKRMRHSQAAAFQISQSAHCVLWAKTSLVYLLDITYDGLCSAKDYKGRDMDVYEETNFPFLALAHAWDDQIHSVNAVHAEELDKFIIHGLVERLLNPNGSHYQGWLESTQIYHTNLGEKCYFPRWKTSPGLEPSLSLAYACYFNLLESVKMILDLNPDLATTEKQLEPDLGSYFNPSGTDLPRTAVEIAIMSNHFELLDLLFDRGADPNGVNAGGDCRLIYALKVRAGFESVLDLLRAGADPNPRGVTFTPLQLATFHQEFFMIETLLDAGSHVNAVGDDEAVVAAIKRDCSTEVGLFSQVDIDEGIHNSYTWYSTILSDPPTDFREP